MTSFVCVGPRLGDSPSEVAAVRRAEIEGGSVHQTHPLWTPLLASRPFLLPLQFLSSEPEDSPSSVIFSNSSLEEVEV